MKKILLLVLMSASSIWGVLDYNAQSLLRSYPIGFFVNANVGYSFKTWDKTDKSSVLYGYVRPNAYLQTSAVVNSARAQLDVSPISPVIFYAGYRYVNRDFNNLDTFNCDEVVCRDQMIRRYWGGKFALKFKNVFLMNDNRIEMVQTKDRSGVFAEEQGSLLASSGKDVLRQSSLITGYEVNKTWNTGFLGLFSSMKNLKNSSRMLMGFAQYKTKNWNLLAGTGTFYTRTDSNVFSTLLLFNWNGFKGLRLF